jgi:hypothetical protein
VLSAGLPVAALSCVLRKPSIPRSPKLRMAEMCVDRSRMGVPCPSRKPVIFRGCPYTDHEWRIEGEGCDAESGQALANFFRGLFRLPIHRDPKAAGEAVRVSYLRGNETAYSLRSDSEDGYRARSVDPIAA